MPEFKFRLATLLKAREATRDQRRVELVDGHRTEAAVREQVDRWQAEWERLQLTTRQATSPGTVAVDRLIDTYRYQKTLEMQGHQLKEQLAALAAENERRREVLLEADRDVRTLEKLRDAQVLRHHQETHRQEIKRLDEATHVRAALAANPVT
jgi:flagellar protein FliJ